MGSSSSTPSSSSSFPSFRPRSISSRSSLSDVPQNLFWCLDEVQRWDQQSHQVKDLIGFGTDEEKVNGFDFDEAKRILGQLDELMPEKRGKRGNNGQEGKSNKSAITNSNQTPLLPHGPASRIFTCVAQEFVLSSTRSNHEEIIKNEGNSDSGQTILGLIESKTREAEQKRE
jgi:hypothetical protein